MQQRDDSDRRLRQHQLLELLRDLADRIHAIDGVDRLLAASVELDQLLGTACSELDYLDTSSAADHQRIVDEARQSSTFNDQPGEDLPWRHPQAE